MFHQNLNFFSTEERKTWTSWMTLGVSNVYEWAADTSTQTKRLTWIRDQMKCFF